VKNDPSLLSPVLYHITDLMIDHSSGAYVYTPDGQRYLDFTSGIAVTNTGHCHPRVVKAIQDQAAKMIHTQINVYSHAPAFRLTEALRGVTPDSIDAFFFANGGAEAIEGAVKLARHATGRTNIIVFQGSFHGRTGQAMSMTTSKTIYRVGYQPLPSGVFVAPFPYWYRYGWDAEEAAAFCLNELDLLLRSQTAPKETAAMVIEPILGEGGYVVPPVSFLQGLRRLCDELGILLILDEIQSGCGRTGKFWAFEHFGIEPDIIVMSKGLGSGFPISAIGSPREIMEKWQVASHGGTFGGNPMACAAAEATIQVLVQEGMVENAARRGAQLMDNLCEIKQRFPTLGDVRGLGLMVGCEFSDPQTRQPLPDVVERVLATCLEQQLILMNCGTYGNVVRWMPPLMVSEAQVDEALCVFEEALREASA